MSPSARHLVRAFAFAGLYLAAGYLGRQTILEGSTFSLIWPAGGVAVLWLLLQRAGCWSDGGAPSRPRVPRSWCGVARGCSS